MAIEYIAIIWLLAVMASVTGIVAHITCTPMRVCVAVALPAPVQSIEVETKYPNDAITRNAMSQWQCGKCNKWFTGDRPIREGYGIRIETCDTCADKLVKALSSKWTVVAPKYSGKGYGYLGTNSSLYDGHEYTSKYFGLCTPMCGQAWIDEHKNGNYYDGKQGIIIAYDGKAIGAFDSYSKRGEIKAAMKQAKQLVMV